MIPMLMPYAFESFDFSKFDIVISVTSAEAKGILTKPKTMHLCYILTPTRYLWSSHKLYLKSPQFGILNPIVKPALKPILQNLRKWDKVASSRPDYYLAISETVKKRVKKYYQRRADIIFPPVDTNKFRPKNNNDIKKSSTGFNNHYFLVVSRLVKYKRVDLIINAFNQLNLPLKIIGDGAERKSLQKLANKNIEFLGQQLTDSKLLSYYQNCAALVFAGIEDFGLVSLEAQACGKPVIAFNKGGIAETVIDGKTGILFKKQNTQSLIKVIKTFKNNKYSQKDCRENALNYSQDVFIKKFKDYAEDKWTQYLKNQK
jgi:glycosyltransferase involved in cell wall biosynthesis